MAIKEPTPRDNVVQTPEPLPDGQSSKSRMLFIRTVRKGLFCLTRGYIYPFALDKYPDILPSSARGGCQIPPPPYILERDFL